MTYEEALAEAERKGVGRCSDPAAMAFFCDSGDLQIAVGAASGKLVWEGAQAKGMTFLELGRLCGSDPWAVHELMWTETPDAAEKPQNGPSGASAAQSGHRSSRKQGS